MQARLKQDCKYPSLRLFFGREYGKTEWASVPEGFEKQAEQSEFLDVRTIDAVVIPAASAPDFPALDLGDVITLEDAPALTENSADTTETFTGASVIEAPAATQKMTTRNRHGGK